MKKILLLLIAAGIGTSVFAEAPKFRLSFGGGGTLTANFSAWGVDEDAPGDLNRYNMAFLGSEIFGFFDATYLEADVGVLLGRWGNTNPPAPDPNDPSNVLGLRFSLYGKYPIAISNMVTIFPLLGASYELNLLAKHDGDGGRVKDSGFPISTGTPDAKASEALNTLWFKIGFGTDINLTDHLFLRGELFYGFRLPNKTEKYLLDIRPDADSMIGHGGDFKIAVGYRF